MKLKSFLLGQTEKAEMVSTHKKGRGGVLGEVGEVRIGEQQPAGRPRKGIVGV